MGRGWGRGGDGQALWLSARLRPSEMGEGLFPEGKPEGCYMKKGEGLQGT